MTKMQVKKTLKKIKDQTYGPIPDYAMWEVGEKAASDVCMNNIKTLLGIGALVYDFGHDYNKACDIVRTYCPNYGLNTDKGVVRVEVEDIVFQRKTWWQRHFCGDHNGQVGIAYRLRGTLGKEGEWYELNTWANTPDVQNVAECIRLIAYQLRDFAETIYCYDFEESQIASYKA